MPKSLSKAMVLPSVVMLGHNTRPLSNLVSCFAVPSIAVCHKFSLPLRSDMKNSDLPSAAHIGHSAFAPRATTRLYREAAATPSDASQISD